MSNYPFVSIIIVNYNGQKYLENCLKTAYATDYPKDKFEVIMVDNDSCDNSIEYARRNFDDLMIICNPKNVGPSAAKNIGVKIAKGDLITFLDNDVEVEKNWLKPLVNVMAEDDAIGICSPKVLFLDNTKRINSTGGVVNIYADGWGRGVFEEDTSQYDRKKDVFFGCSAAMLTKRNIIQKMGCFDDDYFYLYEDVDYSWRANLIGYRTVYVPESIVYHKFGAVMKRDSVAVKYFTERNRVLTLLKNYEAKTIIKILPQFLKERVARTVYHIAGNTKGAKSQHAMPIINAWLWNLFNIHATIKKRKKIQSLRIIPDKKIMELMGDYKFKTFRSD